ncbi:Uncharacterized protein Fot_56530 [Forsythia ovata]|uniref:DUF3613 domain-containing protein n=1 Tax=Forsythia ovata TaxID=205694 RepID=A0ABD1P1V3_9LAMI
MPAFLALNRRIQPILGIFLALSENLLLKMSMKKPISRVRFILSSSIAGVTFFLSSAAATHTQAVAPDEIAKVTATGRREGNKVKSSGAFESSPTGSPIIYPSHHHIQTFLAYLNEVRKGYLSERRTQAFPSSSSL